MDSLSNVDSLFSNDISQLNSLYNRLQFSFVLLYGRQDTGKTTLVREFCRGRHALFYSARETAPQHQLSGFYREVKKNLTPRRIPEAFSTWEEAFSFVSSLSFQQRLILVLDEVQLLSQHSEEFRIAFTRAVRQDFQTGKVFLILTSSSMSLISQLMAEPVTEPFSLVTARACLGSVPFYNCQPFLTAFSPREQLLLYGVTGGLPSYLKRIDLKSSAARNITELFFRSNSPGLTGLLSCLHQELRETSLYNFLMEVICQGTSRLADIAAAAGIGTNKCAKYLNTLIGIGLLKKEFPTAGEIKKKVRYIPADHMVRFWYRFVYPNLSSILFGNGETVFRSEVQPELDGYLLAVFESVCGEYLERLAGTGQTPFAYRHTGSWWQGGTKREPFFRIPLVATDDSHAVLGLCHYAPEPAELSCLKKLRQPLEPFDHLKRYCCIFSSSGFTPELEAAARKKGGVWLVDLEDIALSPPDREKGEASGNVQPAT